MLPLQTYLFIRNLTNFLRIYRQKFRDERKVFQVLRSPWYFLTTKKFDISLRDKAFLSEVAVATSFLLKEKMNFLLLPSLKHIALVKVTTELLNLTDVRDLVARSSAGCSSFSSKPKQWELVKHKVMEKVPELPLPELLKKEILDIILPLCLEMHKWQKYLCKEQIVFRSGYIAKRRVSSSDDVVLLTDKEYTKLLSAPCWTPQGTVDRKKTAKALVNNRNLDITKRYVLACNFCLEDDIKELWDLLPETKKVTFYDAHSTLTIMRHRLQTYGLVILWTYDMKGELTKLNDLLKEDNGRDMSVYHFAFQKAAEDGNKTAAEYFWQKITPLERQESLVWYTEYIANTRTIHNLKPLYTDVLYFLLSQMNEEQQVKIFGDDPSEVLSSMLEWPWQSFFMEAANHAWDFITVVHYAFILRAIVTKIRLGFKDYDYHKLFTEFWEQSPSTCKKKFIEHSGSHVVLLDDLFHLEDIEKIRLILKSATVKEKENIIFQDGKDICFSLIRSSKWELLKFFVQECLSSRDVIVKFKEEFVLHINIKNYDKFFIFSNAIHFLDDLISKKRDMEEDNSTNTAKRHK